MAPVRMLQIAAAFLFALSGSAAQAGLLGSTVQVCTNSVFTDPVTVDITQCDPGSAQALPASAVVGAGVEFDIVGNRFFDFDDDGLVISYVQPVFSGSPDLLIFTMEDMVTGITLMGANPLDVSWMFSGNRIGMLISSPLTDGTVTFRINADDGRVPEPASLALLGLALAGLLRMRRR